MKTTQLAQQAKPVPAADPTTMQAITQNRYGTVPEDVMRLDQVARPGIGDDEVLIQVRAAGVDRGTWHLMAGRPYRGWTIACMLFLSSVTVFSCSIARADIWLSSHVRCMLIA